MLRSRAITRISSLILCCFSLASAGLDEIDTEELEKLLKVPASLNITVSQDAEGVEAGSTPSLLCRLSEPGYILWSVQGRNFSTNESKIQERFDIKQASRNDSGEYTCMAQTNSGEFLNKTINIRVIEPGKVVSGENVRVEVTKPGVLSCDIYGYPVSNFSWQKGNDTEGNERLKNLTQVTAVNETHVKLSLHFKSVTRKDNGTYECKARDYNGPLYGHSHLFVLDAPQINIDFIKAIGAGSIYLNWTVNDGNEPILEYYLQHMKKSTGQWQYYSERIGVGNTSYVLKGFESNASYQFKISARNKIGKSHVSSAQQWVTTLGEDPEFIPKVSVNGVSDISITLRWTVPPTHLREYVHYYTLMMTHGNEKKEAVHPAQQDALYAFEGLSPATTYNFKIAACSEYTKQCGNWSAEVNGTTIDGVPSAPLHISVVCHFDNISNSGIVSATWLPPANPKGQIIRYDIQLAGHSRYRNEFGEMFSESMPLVNKSIDVKSCCNAWLNRKPSNTNYTFSVNGVTRTRSPGKKATGNCTMPATIPDRDSLNQRTWYKIESEGRSYFRLLLPRISERTGPICCYRIFMVRLPSRKTVAELPPPEELNVFSYEFARTSPLVGAYVAEMFDSDQLVEEFLLGNGKSYNRSTACERCIGLRPRAVPILRMFPVNLTPSPVPPPIDSGTETAAVPITEAPTTTSSVPMTTSDATTTVSSTEEGDAAVLAHRKRREVPRGMIEDEQSDSTPFPPHDGFLVEGSNYTGFVEIIVLGNGENQFLPAYSNYLTPLYAGLDPRDVNPDDDASLGVIMHIMIALTVVIVILIGVLCILHRYTKRMQLQRGEEVITLRNSFRHLCRSLRGRHQLVTASPPDMPPIPKVDLLQAYIERHRDSDYGFQHEFELLPDKFTDRTTRASESRENLYKNRYPDIKCYDQTRVRLAQMDGICGSDYINANFVLGYKERKKFICAQGPMENTVCDYWRMIWEQHLELVLMLTNLEEYSKTKCAKYWPDKGETKNFGDITVEHVRERPYSDYVVRELKMTRTSERDVRTIVQYHFLVWKDFMAPEHPHAILRFVKRVNEAYSMEKGPILVHCSAGVGRTGTLVALDSLLQQLAEEGQVSIFNTVCDLRHQRNFLVQSLKQYIFIYRALMEMAQYGDTEIPATQLKAAVERLRQRDNGKEKCRMEEEYDKINSALEDHKSFSVGGGDENRIKNRNDFVIPYDRNRVILTPVPGREHSTYINASFIEGYDNYESFVITQDPLEGTVADFWRMMSEQCVSTIVMLSDLSDGPRKCPRYWPDDEMSYDHIRVRYIQSESCPYYTRRELSVTNTKTDESTVVTHYQYHGWPTVDGEVPEVTRGLIELVDQTLSKDTETGGPLVVHCNSGSDRSSMFVALSILVQQLRTERRVDIFTTTKKLRSQRHGMISTFVQYEFLHRAIVNYSDLHNLADEEPPSS